MSTILRQSPGKVRFLTEVVTDRYRSPAIAGDVEIEIDLDYLLRQLGQKALLSKGKKSQVFSGAIKVKARNVCEVAA